jgi:hypothetical protein
MMKGVNALAIAGAALCLALAILLWLLARRPPTVALPARITTISAGYPFALRVKNQMDRAAHLTTVIIDFERRGERFHAPQILYGFASPKANGRVFAVTVDNTRGEAFLSLDVPNSPDNPLMPPRTLPPLDLSSVTRDISGVLEIARANGLDEFCALAGPEHGNVDLRLSNNSSACPVWSVLGDGWDERGPIADLAITIDARTGSVLSRTVSKAANRP